MKDSIDISELSDLFDKKSEDIAAVILPKDEQHTIINPIAAGETVDESYFESVLLIGGSQMRGLSDYGFIPTDRMLLDDSFTLSQLGSEEITSKIDELSVKAVYIMPCSNATKNYSEENISEALDDFVDKLSEKNIKIFIVSVLPIPASAETDLITNSTADGFNSAMLKYSNSKNLYYLDINTQYKGNDGKLPASAVEGKSTRLKRDVYSEIAEYILSHTGN